MMFSLLLFAKLCCKPDFNCVQFDPKQQLSGACKTQCQKFVPKKPHLRKVEYLPLFNCLKACQARRNK